MVLSHPQTIEYTSNETSLDNLYQDINSVTRGFNPHAGPTMVISSEPPPQELAALTPTLMTDPVTPSETSSTKKPENWDQMSARQKNNWKHRQKRRGGRD